ncbi:MAG: DUF6100 family protein [Clostridiales bacterium]|nr:DUF6100 family protein [Clostridiales bacterium]
MKSEKQQPGFTRCIDSASRLVKKVMISLDEVRAFLENGDLGSAYESAFVASNHSEKLALICREMPVYSGNPQAHEQMEDTILRNYPLEIGFTTEGWFYVCLPVLLPKKNRGSPDYICNPLYLAMNRFWRDKAPLHYPDNVIIFRHVYSLARPERQYRDHDNIELNRIVDILAMYVMVDDSPLRCRHYYLSAPGKTERTEVYVVPQNEFKIWLESEESGSKER